MTADAASLTAAEAGVAPAAELKHYEPIKPVGSNHGVSFVDGSGVSAHDLQCMQHGCTLLRWDAATAHFTPVLLRLENDTRTLSWSAPSWATLRPAAAAPAASQGGSAAGTSSASTGTGVGAVDPHTAAAVLDVTDPRLSPALLARHQLQLPYRVDDFDDGSVLIIIIVIIRRNRSSANDSAYCYTFLP